MQIQNLNALVDTVRHEIIERYRPGEDDPHLKVLQAAHISDDEYFSHMVLDDLNLIIRDIRETHKKDSESAPQTTVANKLKENLEAVENFKGSRDEKLVILYCKQLGINYKNLSEEEFRWFIRILKKSKKMNEIITTAQTAATWNPTNHATAVFLYRFFLWLIGVPIFFDFLRIRMNQRNSSSDRFL